MKCLQLSLEQRLAQRREPTDFDRLDRVAVGGAIFELHQADEIFENDQMFGIRRCVLEEALGIGRATLYRRLAEMGISE